MKVRIGNNEAVNAEDEMIMLIFRDDAERKNIAQFILDMEPKEGVRIFSEQPQGMEDIQQTLIEEAKKHK